MLWLMILLNWALHMCFGNHTMSQRIASIVIFLLIVLGILQLLVQAIDVIESAIILLSY